MIDEREEELASLYAFDLLEGAELAQFEAALARDPTLQSLVRELHSSMALLAHTTRVASPPPALKQRVMNSIAGPAKDSPMPDNVIRPPAFRFSTVIPWAAAACFALGAAWLGQRYLVIQSEALALRDRQAPTEISLVSTRQQLEAERILAQRQLQDSTQQLTAANSQLGATNNQVGEVRTQLADRDRLIAEGRNQIADRDQQLAQARSQLADRERQIAALAQRVDALASSTAEAGRELAQSKQQVASLVEELKSQGDLANLKIATLASMLKNSPQARAVAVWDPKKQEGVFAFEKLPPVNVDQKLEL